MKKDLSFQYQGKSLKFPLFFPDATRAVVRTVDSLDIQKTQTPGILVNTWHLYRDLGKKIVEDRGGIRQFMNWPGAIISDSGGFQVMSLAKSGAYRGKVNDRGVVFRTSKKKKVLFTPERSIQFQMSLKTDLLVVLDDFTPPGADEKQAKETVDRSVLWAKRCKQEFEKILASKKGRSFRGKNRPYLIAVVQGGDFLKLRKECAQRLVKIGFDGLGYGGWPVTQEGKFNYAVARRIAKDAPRGYLLYGLGIGKPDEIVGCVDLGFHLFDCVLPTRDARHKRLYVFNAESIDKISIRKPKFYSYYSPDKEKHFGDSRPVSQACDCLLCTHYSRAYLHHLFKIKDMTALRLATIHNLRFYSLLMEKLQAER
ncbi:tRNA-ribosyltransferase family protein [Patescibacteria group bacterium]